MKISSHLPQIKINSAKPEAPVNSSGGVFKNILEQFAANEMAVSNAIPKVPRQFKGLVELQRSCSALQLQIECASRVADSVSSSIKKIQQMGGQG